MNNLKEIRKDLVNYLYQYDLLSSDELEISDLHTQEVFTDILLSLSEIDDIISENLFNYTIERLGYLDRAIIRVATYELKDTDLDSRIIINEAIVLTKEFSDLDDERQHKFTNKVLDNINKFLRG